MSRAHPKLRLRMATMSQEVHCTLPHLQWRRAHVLRKLLTEKWLFQRLKLNGLLDASFKGFYFPFHLMALDVCLICHRLSDAAFL